MAALAIVTHGTIAPGKRAASGPGAAVGRPGLWPLVSIRTFERITGPKVDRWLVKMVGLLAATIGAVLLRGARSDPARPPNVALAIGAALSFAAVDVVYAGRGRISPIYLGDAVVEVALVAGWRMASREQAR